MTRRRAALLMLASTAPAPAAVLWRELPRLPRALGGHFAGALSGGLIVAGGSHFDTPPWDGGSKRWVDTVYVLAPGEAEWRLAGRLPFPVASGGSAYTPDGLLCLGGQTPDGYTARCHRLRIGQKGLEIDRLPDLPRPVAMLAAACAGDTVYVAGGQASPTATEALHSFLALSLSGKWDGWKPLPDPPGLGRILPVLVGAPDGVYLASGAALTGAPPARRRFLRDAWRYSDSAGWSRIEPLPHATQAASGLFCEGRVLVFGGNDGTLAERESEFRDRHPGFSKDIYSYDPGSRKWTQSGSLPLSLVTSPVMLRNGEFVIAGGEDRPAHRVAAVIAGRIDSETKD